MSAKKEKKKKLVLLDAHAIIHRAYHALPDFTSQKGEPTGALYGLTAMLIKLIKDLEPDYIVAAYDLPEETFRHRAYEAYKATRAKAEEDLVYQIDRSRDVFEAFGIPIYEQSGFEADDIIGTIVQKIKDLRFKIKDATDIDVIIASGDLDTLQLVDDKKVKVYTLKRGLSDTVVYDEKAVQERYGFESDLLPDFKGLKGDPSDNIPGVRGIGDKSATSLIAKFGTIENIYKTLKKNPEKLEKAGIKPRVVKLLREGEEEALFSKTLGQIRRDAPVEFEIPDKRWEETVEEGKVRRLFEDLSFKTLFERFQNLLRPSAPDDSRSPTSPGRVTPGVTGRDAAAEISPAEAEETAIAVWLLDSDRTNPKLEDIYEYTETTDFEEAKKKILAEIKEKNLEYVLNEIELPLIPIIKKMEERGVLIDKKYLRKLSKEYHKELQRLEKNIFEHAGTEFNINSPRQLAEVLFDKLKLHTVGLTKTPGGQRSTRMSELEKLQGTHPIIDDIIAYREYQKLLSTYIEPMPAMADKGGRLHAKFSQAGTTTGRFSSTEPNLQNIPIRGEVGQVIRKAFIAEKGYKLVAFDYSQIDLRSLAMLSGDENLLGIFERGEDIHSAVASRVFGVSPENVTKDMRRHAKAISFGIIYGMGIISLTRALGTTRSEAEKFYKNFFERFSRVNDYLEETKSKAYKDGYTETLFGRRRYFPDIRSKLPMKRSAAERMAVNFPVQGTSADIIKLAIRGVDGLGLADTHLILQVHDELVYEVKENKVKKAAEVVKHAMENIDMSKVPLAPTPFQKKAWRLEVDVSAGQNWGNMMPLTIDN